MSALIDGRLLLSHQQSTYDYIVVGSGPSGSVVANELAKSGSSVLVIEEGAWPTYEEKQADMVYAHKKYYRDFGMSAMLGKSLMPYLQGKVVGGSSVINGAICWRLPEKVFNEWIEKDPALSAGLSWQAIEKATDNVELKLNVKATPAELAKEKNILMAKGAEALGYRHRPIRRNVRNCKASGYCLYSCPHQQKLSMDRSYLLDAQKEGVDIFSSAKVIAIKEKDKAAHGVKVKTALGEFCFFSVAKAVVLAANAVLSPILLKQSGITHGPVGENLMVHPGMAMTGYYPHKVKAWQGASQGHEVTEFMDEGLKFETQGYPLEVMMARMHGVGHQWMKALDQIENAAAWAVMLKSNTRGRVYRLFGKVVLKFSLTDEDIKHFRRGMRIMGEMFLASGANYVEPGIKGFDKRISTKARLIELEKNGPRHAGSYSSAVTHMFGTCKMGSRAKNSVVRPDFRHHKIKQLYIADSSVFPTNTGANPQIAIMAMAKLCAQSILSENK